MRLLVSSSGVLTDFSLVMGLLALGFLNFNQYSAYLPVGRVNIRQVERLCKIVKANGDRACVDQSLSID